MRKSIVLTIVFLSFVIIPSFIGVKLALAQQLESTKYKIIDGNISSGGGVSTGSGYDLLVAVGQTGADTRLESASYLLRSGFPNGIQANVPIAICFETNTSSGTTTCQNIPGNLGMVENCGEPGCYDRAKYEIDDQNNPTDALFLTALSPDAWTTTYYLQSDHTLGTTFDINDYMTQCELEGYDADNTDCDDSGDAGWNENLQTFNILGLKPGTTYQIATRAVNGDFTETQYSQPVNATTQQPTIAFDLDVSETDTETTSPHSLGIGLLSPVSATTATKSIWVDITSNSINGVNIYVNNSVDGLYSSETTTSILSETEDLDIDDGDGGYGLKTTATGETTLGPLFSSATYTTTNSNAVGALSSNATQIFYTNASGSNNGPINNGRGQIRVKARSYTNLPTGNYIDSLTFTALANW